MMSVLACRFCGTELKHIFVDLGMSPMANAYLREEQLNQMEPFFPLQVFVCDSCFLVQLPEVQSPEEIFSDYAYFSSYSASWLNHAKAYVEKMVDCYALGANSQVVEIASNDGYLLQFFKAREVPVLGVEPAKNVAAVAQSAGIPTVVKFFGVATARELAAEGKQADLLLGNNVLAHVPDINDFVHGMKILLKPQGIITMEFPHLGNLIRHYQFDTIYHEHYSYLSLLAVDKIFSGHGLRIFDVEELPTHGGSLRIFACHAEGRARKVEPSVEQLIRGEIAEGLKEMGTYTRYGLMVHEIKRNLLAFLLEEKRRGRVIVGYGAPAKGNTLLNYCGIRTDFLDYTVDRSPHKQGHFLPGTHIPIHPPEKIRETRPDYVLILPWNLKDEIMEQISFVRDWGGRFVVPIPAVKVYE
jgi:SAM-dependent methyltransferase